MWRTRLLILAAFILLSALFLRCEAQSGYVTGGPQSTHSTVIIFIHGWRGSNASWNSSHGGKSLPELIATDPTLASFADVYLFEYDAKPGDPKAELQGSIATHLGKEIFDMVNHGKKNIVLVCHSMGGLIAWAVIDHMQTLQGKDRPFKMVFTFATPYRGTSLSASAYAAQIDQNKQLYALLPAKENPFLNQLENRYIHSSTEQSIDLNCAYETKKTKGIFFIVEPESATAFCDDPSELYIPADEIKNPPGKRTKYPMPGTHEELARPDSPTYPENFRALKEAILESSKKWKQR